MFDLPPRAEYFSPEHQSFRRSLRDFVDREIAPHVAAWDEAGSFPRELYRKAATIGLISFYSASVLRIRRLTLQLTLLLCAIYGFIFVVLQLEDYALLVGSLGLFVALAAVMYYSRNVDWYGFGKDEEGGDFDDLNQ